MRVSEEIIERIKNENDIVDIISESVRLKRAGRNYSGLCPFHNEKSPSFSVSQDKQIYKCFGCGEAGNVITFVMKQKNMNFPEALKLLAERANIPIEMGSGENKFVNDRKEKIYQANIEAGRYFFKNLVNNKVPREYFLNRGIKEQTIKKFGLGFALDGWNGLLNHLRKMGFKDDLLEEAGLVLTSQKTNNKYDRFRNRVMFPVFDVKGRVIGFGGRVLDDSKPKYLNSPETPVFHKGTNLYGLNFAIKSNLEERYFIIVEGYMDLITLNQYGITNVVASLGTALTINQARLMKRYADKVIISYDADFAGQTATMRGLEILRGAGLDVRVLSIPQGKDPDEFVRSNGREAFLKLISSATPLINYRLKRAEDGINLKDERQLIEYGKRVTEVLADLNPVEKDVYIKRISEDTGLREQSIYDLLSMTKNIKEEPFMNKKEESGTKLYIEPAFMKAEKSLLKLLLNEEHYFDIKSKINSSDFNLQSHRKIYSLIEEAKEKKVNNIFAYVEGGCDDVESSQEWVKIREMTVFTGKDDTQLIDDYINQIKTNKLFIKIESLKKELKALEQKGMIEESIKLAMELKKVTEQLKRGERV
ncbi:MAG: DNA primase [Clostridium sp.]